MALIGYTRVSTAEQSLTLQRDALKGSGCEVLFEDHASGAKVERRGLAEALPYIRRISAAATHWWLGSLTG